MTQANHPPHCPTCGRCPSCGQPWWGTVPPSWAPQPVMPYYPVPVVPYVPVQWTVPSTTITVGSKS